MKNIFKITAILWATILTTSFAHADTKYLCGGDGFSADVILSSTKYKADIKIYIGEFTLSGESDEKGYSKTIKFLPKATPPSVQIGKKIFPCEIGRTPTDSTFDDLTGKSLGGKVREGAGTDFKQIDGLDYYTPIDIVADTGIKFGKYNWFQIVYGDKVGFQWGGVICSDKPDIPNLFETCVKKRSPKDELNRTIEGWMAFAIGSDNRWGHGLAKTQEDAENYSLYNCGDNCTVDDVTHAQCHALATVPGGYWYGEAHTIDEAKSLALKNCKLSGYKCEIKFSTCR